MKLFDVYIYGLSNKMNDRIIMQMKTKYYNIFTNKIIKTIRVYVKYKIKRLCNALVNIYPRYLILN